MSTESNDLPLVDTDILLEKFPGKGGWTYAAVDVPPERRNHFGWRRVKGTIDGFAIAQYNLAPMGNGLLFLPIKAEIRKKIRKEAGDMVRVTLYPDASPTEVPNELIECFELYPEGLRFFQGLTEAEKKHYVQWIYEAKGEDTRIRRINVAIDRLVAGKKLYDPI